MPDFRFRDIDTASDHLEGTFLVRLFSEFETALRQFLRDKKLKRPPNAKPMLETTMRPRPTNTVVLTPMRAAIQPPGSAPMKVPAG